MSERSANDAVPRALASPWVRGAVGLGALAFATLAAAHARLSALHHVLLTRSAAETTVVPSAAAVRLLSLGHREWAADLLWCRALLYFGETLTSRQEQRSLQAFADAIEDADPHFREAYLWGATVSIYNAGRIRRESVLNAVHHLERGLRVFPDDGEMIYQLGFDYFFELPRVVDDADEQALYRRRGAEYLRRAAAVGYGPPWMALAAVDALQRAGLTDRAVQELQDLYLRTDDPGVRETLAQQIAALQGEGSAQDPALRELRHMDEERKASFPYVPPMLYLFVGPPVPGVARGAPGAGAGVSSGGG